tara:strand:+ start:228 stop:1001 length:774 start_codon:yes stop_codon:yes gene_type:complete
MVAGKFTKPNYNKKLENIEKEIQKIKILEEQLIQKKINTYGSPDSPFYGLKTPSLPKIIEYMCDTYKLPYDLMMNVVYDNIMKKYYKIHLDNTFSNLKSPFKKCFDDVKSLNYDYSDDYEVNSNSYFYSFKFRHSPIRHIWCERIIKHPKLYRFCDEKLYCGGLLYRSKCVSRNWNYTSTITIQSKKYLYNRYRQEDYDTYCKKHSDYDDEKDRYFKNHSSICVVNKQEIVEQLNKLGVDFKLSWSKEKLMNILMKQ